MSLKLRIDQADVAENFVDDAYDCIQQILKLDPDPITIRYFEALQNYLDEACFAIQDKLDV